MLLRQYSQKRTPSQNGFTLLEILVVVVIVSLIAAIALPSYGARVCKVDRGQVKADLLAYSQAMEHYHSTNNFLYHDSSGNAPSVYASYSPADGEASNAKFTLAATIPSNGRSYTLTATRRGSSCQDGTLAINNKGERTWTKNGTTQNDWNE